MQTQHKTKFIIGDILHFTDSFFETKHNLMLVQTNANLMNLICLDEGNRWSAEVKIDAYDASNTGFSITEIRNMFDIDPAMLYLGYTERGEMIFPASPCEEEERDENQLEFDF